MICTRGCSRLQRRARPIIRLMPLIESHDLTNKVVCFVDAAPFGASLVYRAVVVLSEVDTAPTLARQMLEWSNQIHTLTALPAFGAIEGLHASCMLT